MAIFGNIKIEQTVQVNDKTRIDISDSFVSDEAAITLTEVQPEASEGFVTVTTSLDWSYATDGNKVISLRITTDGAPQVFTATLPVLLVATDKLFSSDNQLFPYEPNLLNWVRAGRNSFLDVHRESQTEILNYLDKNGYWDVNGDPLTKADVIDVQEFRDWSKFLTLKLIFEGLSNATSDIFHEKALRYREKEYLARDRAILRVDLDNDGDSDSKEEIDFRSSELIRE